MTCKGARSGPFACQRRHALLACFYSATLAWNYSAVDMMEGIPAMFPKARWAFIEASSQWVPYVLNDLSVRLRKRGRRLPENPLKAYNMYVTCQVTDDLPMVLPYAGEDNLIIGTDYGHSDTSSEIEALRLLKERGTIPAGAIDKILGANPCRLYGLDGAR